MREEVIEKYFGIYISLIRLAVIETNTRLFPKPCLIESQTVVVL